MSGIGNKSVFAENLRRYMAKYGKTRRDLEHDLNLNYFTVSDWVKGKKYPRIDKIEILARYFGVKKSDLIEERLDDKTREKVEAAADIASRLRNDEAFFELVRRIYLLGSDDLGRVSAVIDLILQKPENKV